jgi:hypothetical protein
MNYTRRRILRDGGRAALVMTASSSLPFLTGCHKNRSNTSATLG